MKICFIAPNYPPNTGGGGLVIQHLAAELLKKGHEVHVITSRVTGTVAECDESGIFVHRVSPSPYPDIDSKNVKMRYLKIFAFYWKTEMIISKIKPDVVHSNDITHSVSGYVAKLFLKIPYTIGIHSSLDDMGPTLPLLLKKYWYKLPYIKCASEIFVLNEQFKESVLSLLGKEPVLIPNGVDINVFSPVSLRENISKDPRLLCIANLSEEKGIQNLLCAMKKVCSKYPNALLTIIGDGPLRESLENYVNNESLCDNIIFEGFVSHDKVHDYFLKTDIYVQSSIHEAFSLAILEAAASGIPLVLTDCGSASMFAGSSCSAGYLVSAGNSEKLSDALLSMINLPYSERFSFSNNGVNIAEKYSWEKVADEYEKSYIDISYSKKSVDNFGD